jgi:hypothetical protein
MGLIPGGRPFRVTATATDAYDSGHAGLAGTMIGAKLIAGGAAATAQLVDADGTVLADLSAPANGADWLDIPVIFRGKVRVGTLTGAGAIVNVWVE